MTAIDHDTLSLISEKKLLDAVPVSRAIDALAESLAAEARPCPSAGLSKALLRAVAGRCLNCRERPDLNLLADCRNDVCPLNPFGPAIFRLIRAGAERPDFQAGGLQ